MIFANCVALATQTPFPMADSNQVNAVLVSAGAARGRCDCRRWSSATRVRGMDGCVSSKYECTVDYSSAFV